MQNLPLPVDTVKDIYLKCVSSLTPPELVTRLSGCLGLVKSAEKEFLAKIKMNHLKDISVQHFTKVKANVRVLGNLVTVNEMKLVYTDGCVPNKSGGRDLYDKLMNEVVNETCPYCEANIATQLDHYLSKARYPLLCVVPANLVPSCRDCNTGKLASYPKTAEEESLHPYFDDISGEIWLKAEVENSNPPRIIFYVAPPTIWSSILGSRVKQHFIDFKLGKLYRSNAATELTSINEELVNAHKRGKDLRVHQLLIRRFKSNVKANKNSWRTALYKAIANDSWYCSEGFKLQVKNARHLQRRMMEFIWSGCRSLLG